MSHLYIVHDKSDIRYIFLSFEDAHKALTTEKIWREIDGDMLAVVAVEPNEHVRWANDYEYEPEAYQKKYWFYECGDRNYTLKHMSPSELDALFKSSF